MSHVNDAKRLAEYKRLLGEPRSFTRTAQVGGRRPLDTCSSGQREFQAMLLWFLLSPPLSRRWDTRGGKGFRGMMDYYSWVSPQRDHLVTGWTVSARAAAFLLPELKAGSDIQDGALQFSGIPGLRVAEITKKEIRLKHLPTGGMLHLYCYSHAGSGAAMARTLNRFQPG